MKTSIGSSKNNFGIEVNTSGVITHDIGDPLTSESFNLPAIQFRQPGLISRSLGTGSFDGSTFTPSQTSTTSAKYFCVENANIWQLLGMVDVRTSSQVNVAIGCTTLFAEGLPTSQIIIDTSKNLTLTNGTTVIQITQNNKINLGSTSPTDAAALASKVDNINNLLSALAHQISLLVANPSTGDISADTIVPLTEAALNLVAGISTVASTTVKISS